MTRRFVRPSAPRAGLELGRRDESTLDLVARFRFLTADQLRLLVAPAIARRVFQRRLRLLFEHRLLDRHRLAVATNDPRRSMPVYGLGEAGDTLLGDQGGPRPHRPTRPPPSSIHHTLVAADFLVALTEATRGALGGLIAALHPEAELWTALARWRLRSPRRRSAIVPDGAVTLRTDGGGVPSTFALEVVRADIRGGSRTFVAKLERYGELARARFFREAFGWERLRAVVVATPTAVRARHLRELAAKANITIPVVFTTFSRGSRAFTPETVRGPVFTDLRGQPFALLPSLC